MLHVIVISIELQGTINTNVILVLFIGPQCMYLCIAMKHLTASLQPSRHLRGNIPPYFNEFSSADYFQNS